MANIRIKVRESCYGDWFDMALCDGKELLLCSIVKKYWKTKSAATRNAKALAKRIGIKYSDEIHKMHGC